MLNRRKWEISVILLLVIGLSKLITPINMESPSINRQLASINKVLTFNKVLCVGLTRLIEGEHTRKLFPVEVHGEDVLCTVIWVMDFSDIDGVVG